MTFPFSADIRAKIDRYHQLIEDSEVDANGGIAITDEMRVLLAELQPYVMSPEYNTYLISKFEEMGISLTITEE